MKQYLSYVLMLFLALHLLYTNSDLLGGLDAGSDRVGGMPARVAFAASYSLITVIVLAVYPRLWLVAVLAVFDGFGVYLKYNVFQEYFTPIAALYFGLYTALIVVSSGLAVREPKPKPKRKYKKS
jgi:hypothetical protein